MLGAAEIVVLVAVVAIGIPVAAQRGIFRGIIFFHLVSLVLIVAGLVFAANSRESHARSSESGTNWGYIVIGATCLILGGAFAFLTRHRTAGEPKGGPPHPLE